MENRTPHRLHSYKRPLCYKHSTTIRLNDISTTLFATIHRLINIAHSDILCDHVPDFNIDGFNVFSLAFWKATSKTFRALNSLHFSFALSRKYKSSIYYHNYFMSEYQRRFLSQQPFTAYRAADVPVIRVVEIFVWNASFCLPFRELVSAQVSIRKPIDGFEPPAYRLQSDCTTIVLYRLSRKGKHSSFP